MAFVRVRIVGVQEPLTVDVENLETVPVAFVKARVKEHIERENASDTVKASREGKQLRIRLVFRGVELSDETTLAEAHVHAEDQLHAMLVWEAPSKRRSQLTSGTNEPRRAQQHPQRNRPRRTPANDPVVSQEVSAILRLAGIDLNAASASQSSRELVTGSASHVFSQSRLAARIAGAGASTVPAANSNNNNNNNIPTGSNTEETPTLVERWGLIYSGEMGSITFIDIALGALLGPMALLLPLCNGGILGVSIGVFINLFWCILLPFEGFSPFSFL